MEVIVAETAGFCRGVKHALEITLEAIQNRENRQEIYTFGPLIHNKQVLAMLEEKGIREQNEIENCAGRKVIVRAHGIPPQQRQKLRELGAVLLDATCKRVARVQAVIKRFSRQGYRTVIVGDEDHAEVIGLLGYTEGQGVVINGVEEMRRLPNDYEKMLLVAQTTQNEEVFEEIQEYFLKKYPEGVVKNTICGATHARQAEIRSLCSQTEAMVIVGGRHSGNTIRLAEVARECGAPTYHIETEADLDYLEMARYASVGVSAGASTPNWIIRKVVRYLESIQPQSQRLDRRRKTLSLLVYSNLYVALGAALLTSVVEALTAFPGSGAKAGMAASYLYAMHTLNHYLDQDAIRLNDPERAAFYQRRRPEFMALSLLAVLISLGIAATQGFVTFLAMIVLVFMGLLYGVPLFPRRWQQNLAMLRIKDIPASRTFLIPIAWASVIVLLPNLSYLSGESESMVFAFWVVFSLVLVRTTLLDLLDVQGDRLGGKETVVVLLGENRTPRFILGILFGLFISLLIAPVIGAGSLFCYAMLMSVIGYVWCLTTCYRNRLKGGPFFETLIESILIGTGLLAVIWNLGLWR
jgi:4-hydroxy-3-methylbut-2-enyl diphosphate reductase